MNYYALFSFKRNRNYLCVRLLITDQQDIINATNVAKKYGRPSFLGVIGEEAALALRCPIL